MRQAIQQSLEKLEVACKQYGDALLFQTSRKEVYAKCFETNYKMIMDHFMSADTTTLDIHKQAAIIAISALEAQLIKAAQPCGENSIFIGAYVVALNVALSYLEDHIKTTLSMDSAFSESAANVFLSMPIAFACNTPYFEIMCRMLYYEDPNQHLDKPWHSTRYNILEWSDRFYLLEYITLLRSGVNPSVYKALKGNPSPKEPRT